MVTGRIGSRSNDRDTWKIQSRDAFANDSATVHARPPWILHFFQLADWNMRVNGRSSNQRTFPEKFIEIDHSTQPATAHNTSFLISFQVIANNSGYSTIFLLIKLLASEETIDYYFENIFKRKQIRKRSRFRSIDFYRRVFKERKNTHFFVKM